MAQENFNILPEDCASLICSLTSPQDACMLSLVSSAFRSVADSDTVWDRFLPSDYSDILARALVPLKFSSKKELFNILCNSILLDGGKKSFALEKSRGRKSYMLSAKEIFILSGNEPDHWNWKSTKESRFSQVAELKTITALRLEAKISTKTLSMYTTYGAYLIMKVTDHAFGLDSIPSETSLAAGDHVQTNTVYLSPKDNRKKQMESLFYANRVQMLKVRVNNEGEERMPIERKDGWMEIEIGDFFTDENDKEITMSVMEIKGHHFKRGLIVEGIEIRPRDHIFLA